MNARQSRCRASKPAAGFLGSLFDDIAGFGACSDVCAMTATFPNMKKDKVKAKVKISETLNPRISISTNLIAVREILPSH